MAKSGQKRSGSKAKRSDLKPEDEALFLSVMKDVKRQPDTPLRIANEIVEPEPTENHPAPKIFASQARAVSRKAKSYAPLSAGRSGHVDGRTLNRLKRGQLRPQARLDLHGMTQDEAHRALIEFISDTQAAGKRCVIIITGRGRISEGGGVLRNQTPNWLNTPAIRSRVLAFATAQPRDGGAGALYVLLRRIR